MLTDAASTSIRRGQNKMAEITLDKIRHSYMPTPQVDDDWAIKNIDVVWEDGGAYALLGPSGCGKSTLLNIISGLVRPSEGRVLFDGDDMTEAPTVERQIAQVFQFPVVYDTMTVRQNLAFPLRNRQLGADEIDRRVNEIGEILDLSDMMDRRAAGLGADLKQKISLGRGIVRPDVNAIMFDEPLTVIDPLMKWELRTQLRQLHQRVGFTMIYVTHDQTEALTFADRVVVMYEGEVVQIGTSEELFEMPKHTFVGHFIGSPGMNVLPVQMSGNDAVFSSYVVKKNCPAIATSNSANKIEIGVRPEFVRFQSDGLPVKIDRVADVGRHRIVDVSAEQGSFKLLVPEGENIPAQSPAVAFPDEHTHFYHDGWLAQ